MYETTLVALATPVGKSALSVIRISGNDSLKVLESLMGDEYQIPKERKVSTAWLYHPKNKNILDQVCIVYFKGPRSYTGEDIIEISCHGNPQIVKNILEACYFSGAVPANKGDFTKRAFINGKKSLPEVEALGVVIDSVGSKAIDFSLHQLKGSLLNTIHSIRSPLIKLLEHIEGSIDFPDEIERINKSYLEKCIDMVIESVEKILSYEDKGEVINHGVKCVFVGNTNAGKSTLFNAFLGTERSIVTNIEGTTRDFITAQLECAGIVLNLYDTAGYREGQEGVEAIGINNMLELIKDADIVFLVVDSTRDYHIDPIFLETLKDIKYPLLLINKKDLNQNTMLDIPAIFKQHFYVSGKNNEGVREILHYIVDVILPNQGDMHPELICNARQIAIMNSVYDALIAFKEKLQTQCEDDQLAWDLKYMCEQLSEFLGESITEEVLDGVFQSFCVGK